MTKAELQAAGYDSYIDAQERRKMSPYYVESFAKHVWDARGRKYTVIVHCSTLMSEECMSGHVQMTHRRPIGEVVFNLELIAVDRVSIELLESLAEHTWLSCSGIHAHLHE